MALNTTSGNLAFLASEVGQLLIQPAIKLSAAAQVSTLVLTTGNSFRIPIVQADAQAAWTAEGAEIAVTDPTLTELVVVPLKIAGLTIISREMAEDASPEMATLVGQSLARDIALKIDSAFVGNTVANGPDGLLSLTTSTAVETATSFTTLDAFASAVSTADTLGVTIDSFVTSPAESLALSTVKESTISARPLLTEDVTAPTARVIYGRPLVVARTLSAKTAWAIPRERVFTVIRRDATIEVDRSVFFTSDRVAVKATMRVGFAFPHPLAVVKITHA